MNTYNNTMKIIAFTGSLAMVLCFTVSSVFAAMNDKDSLKTKTVLSHEETVIIEDILAEFEKDAEIDQLIDDSEITVEVYDQNDQLVFSGSQYQWEEEENTDLAPLKRKAEFLFETEGASVYKIM